MSGKAKRAVLVSLAKEGNQYSLQLDDVESQLDQPAEWRQEEHITSQLISTNAIEKMEFDEKFLADLGYYILARIHAFRESGEI